MRSKLRDLGYKIWAMKSKQGQLKVLGFFIIGAIAFSINTNLDLNPYWQVYLALLQTQGGIFLLIYGGRVIDLSQKNRKPKTRKQ